MNEFKDFTHYAITKYTVGLYIASALSLCLGFTILTGWVRDLCNVLGTGVAVTTLVSSTLNFHFERGIHRHFSIVAGAEKSGVYGLYSVRADALWEINAEFARAYGTASLLSIAGTDFFHTGCPIIAQLDKWCAAKRPNNVRILLLDPRSKHAIDRAILEEGFNLTPLSIDEFNYIGTALWKNIIFSLEQLERLLAVCEPGENGLEVRTYDTAPMLLYAHINDRVFVEQYHYGTTKEEQSTPLTKCLGKKVPVSEYRGNSLSGRLYAGHFDYLWETSKDRVVHAGFSQMIVNLVQEKSAWREIYEGATSASNQWLRGLRTNLADSRNIGKE